MTASTIQNKLPTINMLQIHGYNYDTREKFYIKGRDTRENAEPHSILIIITTINKIQLLVNLLPNSLISYTSKRTL